MRPRLSLVFLSTACAVVRLSVSHTWLEVQCSDSTITDVLADPSARWAAADASTAWSAAVAAWNTYLTSPGQVLGFPEFISNFFQGPEGWDCANIQNTECSTTVNCEDTNHPAGYLILNSLSALHQIHNYYYQALITAASQMSLDVGTFADTFAPQIPQTDGSAIIKDLLDCFAFAMGIGSAFAWNVFIKEAQLFANDNYRGFAKDVFNGAISSGIALGKDNMPSSLNIQNSLSSALGSFFTQWENAEACYTEYIFTGLNNTSIDELSDLIQDGMLLSLPSETFGSDFSNMNGQVQQIVYGMLIPIAWQLAPGALGPFILATGRSCSTTVLDELSPFMTQDTHATTGVCWNGNQFYVLASNSEWAGNSGVPTNDDPFGNMPLVPLPGGTLDVLNGENWGGVTLYDMVVSSYGAYLATGQNNDYELPPLSQLVSSDTGATDLIFDGGIQTAGFFSLNVCTSLVRTFGGIGEGQDPSQPNFPCLRNY